MNNKKVFIFAYKNLWRNKRRTVLNIIGLTLTVSLVIYFLSFYRGTYQGMLFENFIKYKAGHLQIHKKGVNEIDEMINEKMIIENSDRIENELKKIREIKGYSLRVKTYGFISNGKEKFPVIIIGCKLAEERKILIWGNYIYKGEFFEKGAEEMVIGKKLSEILNLKLDNNCYLYTNTTSSYPNLSILKISGIIHTNFSEYDKNTVFLSLEKLQEIIDSKKAINEILIKINNTKDTDEIENNLKDKFKDYNLQINSWKYYGKWLVEDAKNDAIFYYIITGILILISISTVTTTLSVSIFERTKEIGALRALGYQKKDILKLFLSESSIIGILGSISGVIFGAMFVFLNYYFTYKYELGVFNLPPMEIRTQPAFSDFTFGIMLGFATSIIAGYFPAKRAGNMNIVSALYMIR